jgi:diacylglycerol O-acyltransferase / wax synthase
MRSALETGAATGIAGDPRLIGSGRPEPLTAEDARILALESGTVRGHTCKVIVIGGEHRAEEVRTVLSKRIGAFPRLRQRLALTAETLAWVDDPGFAIEGHVLARGPADPAGLRRLVGDAMTRELDRDRPLWAIDVVSPLAGGRTALVWRIHHAIADGMTAMRMARGLLLEPAGERPRDEPPPGPAHPRAHETTRAIRAATRWPAALWRQLGPRGLPTPLDRPPGPRREVAFVAAELERLRAIGHAAAVRATVNDVVLAAVAGGLRSWLEQRGASEERLRVKVPVSLHEHDEADAANRDSFMVVDLPLAQADPLERLCAVARATRACKARRDAETLDAFFRDLSLLSRALGGRAQRWAMNPRVFAVNVSNVPGPRGPQRVLGSPLLELHALAEIADRHALRVSVVSAAGRISFGLCADPDAVGDLDVLTRGIDREIRTLDAAVVGR